MTGSVPPFLIFFAGALVVPLLRRVPMVRAVWLLLIPVAGALNVWGIQEGWEHQLQFLGYTLTPSAPTGSASSSATCSTSAPSSRSSTRCT